MTPAEFDRQYVEKLNPQQQAAVRTVDGSILLLAVPGSGKTTVLITRLGYMVFCLGIPPQSILTMTYTTAATQEMTQRFQALFPGAPSMQFHTINSLSNQIIRTYANFRGRANPYTLIESEEAARIVGQIYQQVNHEYATESIIKDVRTGITYIKNRMLSKAEIQEMDSNVDHLDEIYDLYCKVMKENGLMDFDDQMIYAHQILQGSPAVLDYFQERFPYICVDESQDTSKIQHEIIKLLAQKHGNLFMVGDEDQSIYGFRAAYPEALLHFQEDYPNAKVLLMEQNYRSTREIVAAANAFVAKNRFRYEKTLQPVRESGLPVQQIYVKNRDAQYQYLFAMAADCQEETAILYRNNDSALPLIDLFQRSGIPYNCKRFDDTFFSHRIITDITDIIHFAADPHNEDIFMRIFYKFGSPISRKAAEYACTRSRSTGRTIPEELLRCPDLNTYAKDTASDLCAYLPEILKESAADGLSHIWQVLNYSSYVARNELDAGKYDILRMLSRKVTTLPDLLCRLEELRQIIAVHENSGSNLLTLSTVHSSKGLEYSRVYLLDVFDGILPSLTLSEATEPEEIRLYEEDRRIYYVAMTRAKDQLYLFTCPERDSSFTSEVLHSLPKEKHDKENIFYPFTKNLCGKIFCHRAKGKGKIIAQCGDQMLISYAKNDRELLSLGEMLSWRSTKPTYEKTVEVAKSNDEARVQKQISLYTPGTAVTHTTFGPGKILSVTGGIAEIKFAKEESCRRFSLETCIRQGNLKITQS